MVKMKDVELAGKKDDFKSEIHLVIAFFDVAAAAAKATDQLEYRSAFS